MPAVVLAWLYGDCAPMISEPLRCRVPNLWDSFVLIWNPVALYPYLRYAWDGQDQRDQLSLYEIDRIDVAVECDRNQPRKTLGAYREALPYEKHQKRDSLSITASCLSWWHRHDRSVDIPALVRMSHISSYTSHRRSGGLCKVMLLSAHLYIVFDTCMMGRVPKSDSHIQFEFASNAIW